MNHYKNDKDGINMKSNEIHFKDLFTSVGIFKGRRFYQKEKLEFLYGIGENFKKWGFSTKYGEESRRVLFEKISLTNLFIGDFKKSKLLIVTKYNTPKVSFSKDKPFRNKNVLDEVVRIVFFLTALLATIGLVYFVLYPAIETNGLFSLSGVLLVLVLLFSLYILTKFRLGIPRKKI